MNNPFLKKAFLLTGLLGAVTSASAQITVPEEVEAFEPFTVLLDIMHLHPPHDYVFVDVRDKVILIGHKNIGMHFPVEPPTPTVEVEIQGLSPGEYTFKIAEMSYVPDEEAEISESDVTLTIPDVPPTVPAFAFFHEGIKHYFVTASEDEAWNTAEHGWNIVDFGFNVWPEDGPAPSAAVPVCRFYSKDVNSHFYTADATECEELQVEQDSWQYEGIAFQALLPVVGACPAGTDPVWRLYNNRFAEMDSNHRFVASSETYRTMIADGWQGEGVAFCSPFAVGKDEA